MFREIVLGSATGSVARRSAGSPARLLNRACYSRESRPPPCRKRSPSSAALSCQMIQRDRISRQGPCPLLHLPACVQAGSQSHRVCVGRGELLTVFHFVVAVCRRESSGKRRSRVC